MDSVNLHEMLRNMDSDINEILDEISDGTNLSKTNSLENMNGHSKLDTEILLDMDEEMNDILREMAEEPVSDPVNATIEMLLEINSEIDEVLAEMAQDDDEQSNGES